MRQNGHWDLVAKRQLKRARPWAGCDRETETERERKRERKRESAWESETERAKLTKGGTERADADAGKAARRIAKCASVTHRVFATAGWKSAQFPRRKKMRTISS